MSTAISISWYLLLETMQMCMQTESATSEHLHTHLLGDGGVWRDMVGTPVVGVIWLGSCVPCVRFRFNWGVLFPMPLTEKPSAPAESHGRKTGRKTNAVRQLGEDSSSQRNTIQYLEKIQTFISLVLFSGVPHKYLISSTALVSFYSHYATSEKTAMWVTVERKTYFVDHTNLHQAATADLTMMVRVRTASGEKHLRTDQSKITRKHLLWCADMGEQTHVFVRPMWEHRRLVVVHAFISKVVIDYLDELYKFLSSTKHAFRHLKRENRAAVKDVQGFKRTGLTQIQFHSYLHIYSLNTLIHLWKWTITV